MCAKQLLKEEVIAKGSCLVSSSCGGTHKCSHLPICNSAWITIKPSFTVCAHSVYVFSPFLPVLLQPSVVFHNMCFLCSVGIQQTHTHTHLSTSLCSSLLANCAVVARSRAPSGCIPRAPLSLCCSTLPVTMPCCTNQLWPALECLAYH